MPNRFFLLSSVVVLASCAYGLDRHIQDVKITTPGAHGSVCYAYVDGLRYRMHPPQTISVNNTREDLIVDCLAPGNRRKKVVVKADVNDTTFLNATNAGVGLPWDVFSGAAFKFPDIVEVNFTSAEIQPEKPPAQNAPDIKQPEEYMLEEFLPSQPKLNSDRRALPFELRERNKDLDDKKPYIDHFMPLEGEPNTLGKSDLSNVIEDLNPSMKTHARMNDAPLTQIIVEGDGVKSDTPTGTPTPLVPAP